MEIILEKMEEKHIAELAELEKLCFSTPWSADLLRAELENPLSEWVVAVCGGKAAGYAGCQCVLDEGSVMNVAVAPELRRCGLGSRLMDWLCRCAGRRGLAFLTLEVREGNAPARALYEKFGFETVGRRRNYYDAPREDALIMKKTFSGEGTA